MELHWCWMFGSQQGLLTAWIKEFLGLSGAETRCARYMPWAPPGSARAGWDFPLGDPWFSAPTLQMFQSSRVKMKTWLQQTAGHWTSIMRPICNFISYPSGTSQQAVCNEVYYFCQSGVQRAALWPVGVCVCVCWCFSWTLQWTRSAARRTLSPRWASMVWWRFQPSPRAPSCRSLNTSAPSAAIALQVSGTRLGSSHRVFQIAIGFEVFKIFCLTSVEDESVRYNQIKGNQEYPASCSVPPQSHRETTKKDPNTKITRQKGFSWNREVLCRSKPMLSHSVPTGKWLVRL